MFATPFSRRAVFSILTAALLVPSFAEAALTRSPALERALETSDPSAYLPVLVALPDQFDGPAFAEALRADGADPATIHHDLMLALKDHASRSQSAYLPLLEEEEARGMIRHLVPLWIMNGFHMETTPAGVERLGKIFEDGVLELDRAELVEPVRRDPPSAQASPGSAEWSLRQINAHKLWEMGIKGQGMLVCNLDTGVDGEHVALASRWRGREPGVEWWEAWLAEDDSQEPWDCDSHGTHTMGTMAGLEEATSDTVGVAPAAKWIAARISLNACPGVSPSVAFQWAGDPDDDPGTTDDVPVAVNNSWGFGPGCTSTYWTAIDNMEALGPASIWAAGNDGPGAQTVGSPASRATTHTTNFAVGATDENRNIAGFSSRGPTRCNVPDSLKFKPEVAAPGAAVRSTIPGNRYASFYGTSMAAPHVAGAVALLRQILPALTVDQVKMLLYRTATHPTQPGSEDNDYGRGIVNLEAAADYLFTTYNLDGHLEGTVTDAGSGEPLPQAQVEVVEALLTQGVESDGSFAFHLLARTFTVVTTAFGYYPDTTEVTIPGGGTVELAVQLRQLPFGTVSGTFTGQGADPVSATVQVYLESPDTLMATTHTDDQGRFTADVMVGSYRVEVKPAPPERFFTIHGVEVDSGGVTDLTQTVDVADVLLVDADGGSPDYAGYFIAAVDSAGRTYNHWDRVTQGDADGAVAVMPAQSKIVWFSGDAEAEIVSDGEQAAVSTWLDGGGLLFLSGQNLVESIDGGALAAKLGVSHGGNTTEHYVPRVAEDELGALIEDIYTTGANPPFNQTSQDLLELGEAWSVAATYNGAGAALAHRSFTGGGQVVISGFGLEGTHGEFPNSTSRTELMTAVLDWLDGPHGIGEGEGGGAPPANLAFGLDQNHPNPFNPSTRIGFTIPSEGPVRLAIFDARGKRIRLLVDDTLPAGHHSASWDGRTDDGEAVPSGVYFYRLEAGNRTAVHSMVLVK